jgi:hypothetical protein
MTILYRVHDSAFTNRETFKVTVFLLPNIALLIDNIFASFGGTLFQQVVGIPMGTNFAPLLADLFLYSYESEFLQKLVKDKMIHEARAYNFTLRYIDDVLSINNSRFAEFLPLIYPPELEVKETTANLYIALVQ